MKIQQFMIGDVIRLPNYETCGGFRCWKIVGHHLGVVKQEGTYNLLCLDVSPNSEIQVPCLILESHPFVARI